MTREEAVLVARTFMVESRESVLMEPMSVRRMQANEFNDLIGRKVYSSDFWVVAFERILPPDVAEDPGAIWITVVEATGEVFEDYPGRD